ncbi:hypothetical protein CPB84DRAFT_1815932 [Gymnopilus junonius]|uniref:Protein SMG7 n=1 Tax=Gymnopilus junonius TaxID=109634 RepID=A0A9P5TMQ5_GYMJU|nr:hypothetical protein CPB84DRAFT_1815932 [Gymnopilus junonius]
MTEQPATVAREAKSIHQSLKELLKSKEPFDKEVDFQRKNLRRRYLILLLVHPDTRESKDVENHLWMQTSYAFISSYKQRIAALDRIIQNNQRQQQQGQGQQPQPRQNNNHGVVEHRKLVQRFRQFLADEEKFWTQVVLRLRRLFDLSEAQPALITLASGRNHFQFPPDDPNASFTPSTPEERESRMAILSKALICLGDIARYRELYNESHGRRAGHEDGPPRRGRSRRGGAVADIPPRPRNYDKARQCYEQARLLVPYEGNPSHQLAILSSYQKDSFSSLIHYYRALCVSQPYDTAAENLGTVLTKALESWRQRSRRERDRNGANDLQLPTRVRIDIFKERVVVLHALWRVGMEKGIENLSLPNTTKRCRTIFYSLVSERHLSVDMISNTIVLSQGALWKHRMIRDNSSTSHRRAESAPVQPGTATLIEWGLLDNLMDMHLVLLEVGKDELKDPPQMDAATFRRTLPALRIASKWLRANYKYVMQDQEFIAFQVKESMKGVEVTKEVQSKISGYSSKTLRFWKTFAQFVLALSHAFPVNKLPIFSPPLEEDVEMKGFLPLRKLMGEEKKGKDNISGTGVTAWEQPHPNVEQLMRIYDLLEDAKILVQMEVKDVRAPSHPQMMHAVADQSLVPQPQQQQLLEVNPKQDPDADDMTVLTSRTDDELLFKDAFNHLNEPGAIEDEDEQDDEIVWDPSQIIVKSPMTISPKSPVKKPIFNSPPAIAPPTATTAQDLLNDVLNFPSRPTPTLLFGSELSHRTSQSIWSASADEQPLRYTGNTNSVGHGIHGTGHVYQTPQRQFAVAAPDFSQQSIWSSPSSYPSQTQNSQQNLVAALPSAPPLALPPHSMLSTSGMEQRPPHQRIQSGSVSAQLFQANSSQLPHDPFAYSPIQPPIQRPEQLFGQLSQSNPGYNIRSQLVQSGFMRGGGPAEYYATPNPGGYHSRQVSMHDPRIGPQSYMPAQISQVWGNNG